MFKASEVLRFLGALVVGALVLVLLVLRVTSCAPQKKLAEPPPAPGAASPARVVPGQEMARTGCRTAGWSRAASANAHSLATLPWSPFGRQEFGWEVYVPLIQAEIGADCPPDSESFAARLAAWENARSLPGDGILDELSFAELKGRVQNRREFVKLMSNGGCPSASDVIAAARLDEGYSGKPIQLRPGALRAYREMVAAAKAEDPRIAADPRNLTIFSGYRSPAADAARCATEGNCDGVVRARCSAHRTGLAMDMYVGQAPGYGPDSSADPNRLFMSKTPTYQWLVRNAHRFGFVNYPFEPWHWEWTGEQP